MSASNKNTRRLTPAALALTGTVALFFILVFANFIIAKTNVRWDVTEDSLYSLSDSSKKILEKITTPVDLKFFVSSDNVNLPANLRAYAKRIEDFLNEYDAFDKVNVEIINTAIDTEEEEWAQKYGIQGLALPDGDKVYFGLVALSADQEEAIPYLDMVREPNLEYDISRIITKVQHAKKQSIGILTELPVFGMSNPGMMGMQQGMNREPWMFVSELKKTYDVVRIDPASPEIPKDLSVLILLAPRELDDKVLWAVENHIRGGGNAIVFADPLNISGNPQAPQGDFSMKKLFSAWGIGFDSTKIVADYATPTRLMSSRNSNQVESNPLWLSLTRKSMNTDNMVSGQLETMLLPMAGAITRKPDMKLALTPLIQSTEKAALVDAFRARYGGGEDLAREFKPTGEIYNLALSLTGSFPTAFPDGAPKDDTGTPAPGTAPETVKEATVIIVGDADLIFDPYYVERQNFLGIPMARVFNDNLNFVQNAGELLSGNPDLISIRSGGTFSRPFTRVQELERQASERWMDREMALEQKAEETNQKLQALNAKKDSAQQFVLSPEQEAEIRKFQEEKRRVNKELKEVRRNLRGDIESLGNRIKFMNIFLIPILVGLFGIGLGIYKRNRR